MEKLIEEVIELKERNSCEIIKAAALIKLSRDIERIADSLEDINNSIKTKFGYNGMRP